MGKTTTSLCLAGALLAVATASSPVMANKQYVATPAQSSWKVAVDTPLECRMLHSIPNFGEAQFTSPSEQENQS